MSKRPHDDVDKTEEDLNQQFYTGGIGRRRVEVATHMATMGLRSGVVLPMPVFFQTPYAGTPCPGTEALRFASLATVVHTFQFPSALAAGGAAAMQDDTASGQEDPREDDEEPDWGGDQSVHLEEDAHELSHRLLPTPSQPSHLLSPSQQQPSSSQPYAERPWLSCGSALSSTSHAPCRGQLCASPRLPRPPSALPPLSLLPPDLLLSSPQNAT